MLTISELIKYYKNKRVLITGHTGFKGAYMCMLLKFLGAKVYGYALKEEKGSLYDILKKEDKEIVTDNVYADIRDYKKLKSYIEKVEPHYILHMAAQPLVIKGYENPRYTYETNVMGTVNLMDAIYNVYGDKKRKIPVSILNVTTDKVYENNDRDDYAFKEHDKLSGKDPYANSKSCSELVTYSYNKSFFTDKKIYRVSTARAGNVIGGGDINKDRILPDCYRAIKENKAMVVRNPISVRPYQYVLEPLILYLNIMAYQISDIKYEGNYNIGPDKKLCLTTKCLVEKFFEEFGGHKTIFNKVNLNAFHEAKFLRLDNTLVKKVFGYKAIYNMETTIKYTADIYKLILSKQNVKNNINEIIEATFNC